MATQEDELALRLTGLTLVQVSRILHNVADRLDESGRAVHQPNPLDTRGGYYPDTDTESTTSSHDWRQYRRGRPQGSRLNRSESESRGGNVHNNPLNAYPPYQSTQRRRYPDAASLQDLNHPGAAPRLSQDRAPHSNSNYSDPRVARRSNYSEPRAARRSHTSQSEYGRDGQSGGSPPPSPTPLRRRSSQQPPQSLSSHQALDSRAPTQPHSYGPTPSPPISPTMSRSNDANLGDIFDLDETLVQLRTPDCNPVIHCPPRGVQGSQSRWYFVCCGRKVGIFNKWNEVQGAITGVSGSHQQRVATETLAYTHFKRALFSGKVEVTE